MDSTIDKITYKNRIAALRREMLMQGIELYVVTGLDSGLASSTDEYWDTLRYLTGFTSKGDGTLLVTMDKAYFFCDSRYVDNIFNEIDKDTFLLVPLQHCSSPQEEVFCFISHYGFQRNDGKKVVVGGDPRTIPYPCFRKQLNIEKFVYKPQDLINKVWTDRPTITKRHLTDVENYIFDDTRKYIFEQRCTKLNRITKYLEFKGEAIDAFLTTMEDEIAYLLNLRAFDGGYTQSAMGVLIVMPEQCYLFTDAVIDNKALDDFKNIGSDEESGVKKVFVFSYSSILEVLPSLLPQGSKIGVSHGNISLELVNMLSRGKYLGFDIIENTPSVQMSVKSEGEVEGMRLSHINDGVAFARFIYKKLYKDLNEKFNSVDQDLPTEEDLATSYVSEKKNGIRGYITESFSPIIAFNSNAKCPHYTYKANASTMLKKEESTLMLMDVGSQYEYGTTDFTRTIALGNNIKNEWKRDYTLVLKAHLDVIMGKYKLGAVSGYTLDTVARRVLWNNGLDYEHGTGHGIDCWGNVHGIYPRLSQKRSSSTEMLLRENMMFSVEPGLYSREGYGIRIENIVMVKREDKNSPFVTLESLTLCPYDRNLIDKSMLSNEMIDYINDYHERVYNTLVPYLNNQDLHDDETVRYLYKITRPL